MSLTLRYFAGSTLNLITSDHLIVMNDDEQFTFLFRLKNILSFTSLEQEAIERKWPSHLLQRVRQCEKFNC